ncbi:restriction endonuclease [bacterium]|nr:restriction endonuclease [bacterium]
MDKSYDAWEIDFIVTKKNMGKTAWNNLYKKLLDKVIHNLERYHLLDKKEWSVKITNDTLLLINNLKNILLNALCKEKVSIENFLDKIVLEPKPDYLSKVLEEPKRDIPHPDDIGFFQKMNIILIKDLSVEKWIKQQETNIEKYDRWKAERNDWHEKERLFYKKRENAPKIFLNYLDNTAGKKDIEIYLNLILKSFFKGNFLELHNKEFELFFIPENKILIIDYQLPAPEEMPVLKELKYIQRSNTFKEMYFSNTDQKKFYDDVLYQIVLKTISDIFSADTKKAVKAIVFNGKVKSIDKGTGHYINPCILSIQIDREEIMSINLELVDPKECFRKLRGVGSANLHGLVAIAPILNINKKDKRFTVSYDVANSLDDQQNLAAMDWQDFEHLIRELFEKEYASSGGEVKVTRASRDGGVDAIAFDSDPIKGGKIVIQAKRYTNVVGVSAVRDLYGTVLNEGAMKGILVTTSNYGPDAYKFAKDKPLSLINGNNLLHLLEKHGHRAKINLREAKKILSEEL